MVTTDSLNGKTPEAYADDFYDNNGYGFGTDCDGVLLLVSTEDQDWHLSTCGYGMTAITDDGIEYISNKFLPDLSDGDYMAAFAAYAELCDEFITQAKTGQPYDGDHMQKAPFNAVKCLLISMAIGLVIALIVTGSMKAKLKSVRMQSAAASYVTSLFFRPLIMGGIYRRIRRHYFQDTKGIKEEAICMLKRGEGLMAVIIMIIIALGASFCLVGCAGETYRVDYCGDKDFYKGAKNSYRAGQEVTLYYTMIATDTDYSFYLDGESIKYDYDDRKGIIIRFTMPDHDVKLEHRAVNSMIYVPPQWEGEPDVMLLDYCRATVATVGGGYHELVITTTDDPEEVRLDEFIKEEGEEENCRSWYIPFSAAQEILDFVDAYGLAEWNDMENGISIDGARKVCEYWDGEGYIRVSTDHMPEDGEETLDTLYELVISYVYDDSEE